MTNKYTKMQQETYDFEASKWTINNRNPVVGAFDDHNKWSDYDIYLFKGIDTTDKVALDFGCGPGRNIVKFADRFKQIDGADISDINLSNAKIWFKENNLKINPNLFKNNGIDLDCIESFSYDIVFSTICMQHICVHDIRFSLMSEFFRVLNSGGKICIQMGFGLGHPRSSSYFENNYNANGTNSEQDVRIENVEQLKSDLDKIGFINFEYDIRPTGPGDGHGNWIFFRSQKPSSITTSTRLVACK